MTEDTLDSLDSHGLVLGKDLFDPIGDLPVASSRLDETDGSLGGLVRGGEEGSADVGDGGGGRGHDDTVREEAGQKLVKSTKAGGCGRV